MRSLSICVVSTTPPRSKTGNRVTAVRWAQILKALGHRVRIETQYRGGACDLLVALHARRSYSSVVRFRRTYPGRPVILALTGTDLYKDIHAVPTARSALGLATRLITLQPLGLRQIPRHLRFKSVPIFQSAIPPKRKRRPRQDSFEVCVLGHLRPVKDPLRAAYAARLLPARSRIRILHLGAALSSSLAKGARRESLRNPRYRWMGELSRARALYLLSGCRVLVLTSRLEGGANAVTEALACGVPVISSRIDGSIGLLGQSYPGYFAIGSTRGLARLLLQVEEEPRFLARLRAHCRRRARQVAPSRERAAWKQLLRGLSRRS